MTSGTARVAPMDAAGTATSTKKRSLSVASDKRGGDVVNDDSVLQIKRERAQHGDDEQQQERGIEDRSFPLLQLPPPERKLQLPPAHEVRFLREENQRLQRELQLICAKWRAALPDPRTRLAACEAAKQKIITSQVEVVNAQLKAQLLQQQLYYAMLQSTLSTAPLYQMSRTCDDMLERMHGFLHLGTHLGERVEQLQIRFDLAIRMAASTTDAFTKDFTLDCTTGQLVPFSRTSAWGTESHTLISNVFICKIPIHSSLSAASGLQRVFDAAVASHTSMQSEITQRLGIRVETELVHELSEQRSYVQVTRRDGELSGATSTIAFAAERVSDDLAVIVTDFTDEDELLERVHSSSKDKDSSEHKVDACSILTLTRHFDETERQHSVLLRRLHVLRYDLLAHSPLLFRELSRAMPYINGDLPMALLCEAMQTGNSNSSSSTARSAA